MGLPGEVNQFYADGRKQYLADMDGVIGKVADLVGAELTSARARIAQGKADVHKYVTALPKDLQQVGKDAESKLEAQFDQLSSDVDSKQNELVDTLARKYVEARDALDARIDEMKAANRGLVDKALDAIGGVIKTILQLKNMLLAVLAKAADVIGDIIADPIGFLGKLIDGIKAGLNRFVGNIGAHLQEGLMGWLFGALGGAGITIPKTFDLAGIVDLVLQVLGLTYQNIRARVVRIVGEPLMQRMEQTVDVFKTLVSEGVSGLWRWIKDRVGDLEDLVIGQIKTFIIEKVIKAGVVWLIAFLNPAAAFIKACKMIVDVITFLIERGSEIMSFVNSILDSIGAVAKGAIGIVAEKIESSLAKALPLAISFLASLLGLGGIAEKIHSVIDKVRGPVNKAVDFVVMGAVKGFRKVFGKVKGAYDKGKQWVKGKVKGAKDWAKGKVQDAKDRFTPGKAKDDDHEPAAGDGADAKKPEGPVQPVVKHFAMEGQSHELTLQYGGGGVSAVMASNAPANLVAKVNAEIATHKGIVEQLRKDPDADPALIERHVNAQGELQAIVTGYDKRKAEIQAQHATLGTEGISRELAKLAEEIAPQIVQVAARYRLDDFARRTFEIQGTVDSIKNVVVDQIEKHKDNPNAKGDGMAYTAAAAENYLGWVHPTDQRHSEKVGVAIATLDRDLAKLEWMTKNGVDMTGERWYVRGRSTVELCRRALADPGAFLWARGFGVMKEFIDDMDARGIRGNKRQVDEIRRHFGMPLPTRSGTP